MGNFGMPLVSVRQEFLLFLVRFEIYLERIMHKIPQEYHAFNISQCKKDLTNRLYKKEGARGIEFSKEIEVNSMLNTSSDISINGKQLEEASSFIIVRISYIENKTNESVQTMTTVLVGPSEPLLAIFKRQKLA
ncbi:hypothetical protein DPMN_116159 [Dreissena polymorpha]|uniref:Uncharacterized protein n=1 Tax=Dreissena polymorpha TaxID=45954 RepID=A0A9D4QU21_DREPO|nr:hypothetical protein DPMN_116159 [Dreissena polymorpha]